MCARPRVHIVDLEADKFRSCTVIHCSAQPQLPGKGTLPGLRPCCGGWLTSCWLSRSSMARTTDSMDWLHSPASPRLTHQPVPSPWPPLPMASSSAPQIYPPGFCPGCETQFTPAGLPRHLGVGVPIRSSPACQRPVLYLYVIISAQTPADPYSLVLRMFFTCLILRSIPLLCHTLPHVTDFVHFHQRLCHAVQYSFLFRYPPVQPYRSCFVLYLTCICHLYCALGLSLPSVLHSRLHMPY